MPKFTSDMLIASPDNEITIPFGWVMMRGYLPYAVKKIEISADGGHSWHPVETLQQASPWAWGFWETRLYLPEGDHLLMVRPTYIQAEDRAMEWSFESHSAQICICCV